MRLLLLGIALVAAAVAVPLIGGVGRGEVENLVDESGAAGPLVFVALYAVLTVLLFPGSFSTAAAGVLFGVALGTALAVVGATLGATAAFLVGRRLGREQVEQIAGSRIGGIDRWIERHGLLAVLYVRLIPVIPFNALNYAAGITGVRRRDYVIGTGVGIIPGAFAYAALGGSLDDPTSPAFLGALGMVVVLAVAGPFVNKRLQARGKGAPEPEDD